MKRMGRETYFWRMFGIIKERGVYLEVLKCGQTQRMIGLHEAGAINDKEKTERSGRTTILVVITLFCFIFMFDYTVQL